jgi:hypothetical protein
VGRSRQLVTTLVPAAILRPIFTWRSKRSSARFKSNDPGEVFTEIFGSNHWGSASVSGTGSEPDTARNIAAALARVLTEHGISSMLDVPCGDFSWMSQVDLSALDYTGGDIVQPLIEAVSRQYAGPRRRFVQLDLTHDTLPAVDMIFCRDCFIHLPFELIHRALANIRTSGAKYLMTTTYQHWPFNYDTNVGGVRAIDLCRWPFNLPKPIEWVPEEETAAGDPTRGMGLWRLDEL